MSRRLWVVGLGGLLLLDMAAVTVHRIRGGESWERCLGAPRSCAGEPALLTLYRVESPAGAEAYLQRGDHRLRVVGAPAGAVEGAEVSVRGVYRADGSVGVTAWYEHPGRPAKRWLGLIGLVVAFGLPLLALKAQRGPQGWTWGARWPTW